MARSFSRAASDYIQAAQSLSGGSAYPFTIAAWIKTSNLTDPLTIASISLGSSTRRHALTVGFDTTARIQFMSDLATSPVTATSGTEVTSNTWHHAAGWVASNSSRAAYIDGTNRGTNGNSKTWTNGVDRITVGAEDNNNSLFRHFDGVIAELGIWNDVLTDEEVAILALGVSPLLVRPQNLVHYQPLVRDVVALKGTAPGTISGTAAADHPRIFMPRSALIWPGAVGAGPISLNVAAAVSLHVADAADLTQGHMMDPASAAHVHAASAADLTQGHMVAPAAGAHIHTAAGVTIGQANALLVSGAAHPHISETVTLGQIHELPVAGVAHVHQAGGPDLTQAHAMAIAAAFHAHAAGTADLSAAGDMTVAGAAHAHTAAVVDLTQTHMIAIEAAVHVHAAGTPTLSVGSVLVVASAAHLHTVDPAVLTQVHDIVVAPAIHAHLAATVGISGAGVTATFLVASIRTRPSLGGEIDARTRLAGVPTINGETLQ